MSETTAKLSIQIEAKVAEAKQAVDGLTKTVTGYGKESANASKQAAAAGKTQVAQAKQVTASQKEYGEAATRANAQVKTAVEKVSAAFGKLKTASSTATAELVKSTESAKTKMAQLKTEMDGTERKSASLGMAWGRLAGAWLTFSAAVAGGGLIGLVEDMQRLDARLAISEGGAKKAAVAMSEIKRIANDTRTPVKNVADAYIRFSTAIQRAGGSQKEAVTFTENLSKALKVSGASAEDAGGVMLQLGQAFDSGKLQGDEFRSVAERGGMVLNYLADALKVSRGELRKMATDGELTTDKLLKFNDAGKDIAKDFAKVPLTAGDALVVLGNSLIDIASKSTTLKLIVLGLGKVLLSVAENLGKIISISIIGGLTTLIVLAGGVSAAFSAAVASVVALRVSLTALMSAHPYLLVITAALTTVVFMWEEISGAWDSLTSFFASKPSKAATDDMVDQVSEVEETINKMTAKLGPALELVNKKIEETRKAAATSMKGVITAYSEIAGQIENSAKDQVATVKDRYDAEKRMIDETQAKSDGRYIAEARALITATQEQLQIMRDAAGQKIALLDNEAGLRRTAIDVMFDNERERAQALQELDSEILSKKRGVLAEMLSDYRSHVDNLNAQAQRHFDAVKAIEDQKAQLTMSAEDKIRAYQQSTMGEYQAYQDRVLQVDEALSKSRAALVAGDSQLAQEYAKKAMDATGQIASAVKEDGKEVLSQAQAAATAIAKVEEAKNLGLQAMTQLQTKQTEAGNALQGQAVTLGQTMQQISADIAVVNGQLSTGAQFTIQSNAAQVRADVEALNALITEREVLMTIQTNIDELKEKADSLKERLEKSTTAEHTIDDNADKVQSAINQLKRDTESTHTIYIRRVEKNAAGGMVGGYASGGPVWRKRAGKISGPGTGTSDSIFAKLSNGEFVIRAAMVKKFGASFFNALNSGFLPPMPRFATGGPVNVPVTGGSLGTMNVNFRVGDMEIPIQVTGPNAKQQVRTLVKQLNREKLVAGV